MKVVKEHYADFKGRARRKEFWMFSLVSYGGIIVLAILSVILGQIASFLGLIISIIMLIACLAIIVPGIAVGVRRMHDVGKDWWYIFIPIYSFILAITEGEKGDNQYGPDPKAGER